MEWLEVSLTRWFAIRARGTRGIQAAVFLILWLTALGFAYLVMKQ